MAAPDLRPLSFGELLDRTFVYYRRHFWLFIGIAAVPQSVNIAASVFQKGLSAASASRVEGAPARPVAGVVIFFGAFAAAMVMHVLAYSAIAVAASEIHLGREVTVRQAYAKLAGSLWKLTALIVSIFLRLAGCVLTLILAPLAVLLALWYAFAIPVLLVERTSPRRALKRSHELANGYLGRICLVSLLMIMVSWTVSAIAEGPFVIVIAIGAARGLPAPYWLMVLMTMAAGVAGVLTSPLLMIPVVLLYYDSRARKEGYDVQVLLDALPWDDSTLGPRPEPPVEPGPCLEKTGVPWVIFLTLITLGLYVPWWVVSRRKALNSLRSSEKLSLGTLMVILSAYLLFYAASLAAGMLPTLGLGAGVEIVSDIGTVAIYSGAVALLFQLFKVRRILMDHYCATRSGPLSIMVASQSEAELSGVATFFLGIYYLQYKINRLLESSAATAT